MVCCLGDLMDNKELQRNAMPCARVETTEGPWWGRPENRLCNLLRGNEYQTLF